MAYRSRDSDLDYAPENVQVPNPATEYTGPIANGGWGTAGDPWTGNYDEGDGGVKAALRPIPGMLRVNDPAPYINAGLTVTKDPKWGYLIEENKYNALPEVQDAANSNGVWGGLINKALVYAPLVAGAVVGAAGFGVGPLAEAGGGLVEGFTGAVEQGSLLNAADSALIDAASAGVGGNTGTIVGAASDIVAPAVTSGAVTASSAPVVSSMAAADNLGLAQMALDAGVTNPMTAAEFVSGGGALGSTAAGGGGIGLGSLTNSVLPTLSGAMSTAKDIVGSGQSKGLVDKAMEWAAANPKLAAAALQMGGSTVAGLAKGAGDYMSQERKAELELENKQKLTQYYRDFVQKGSQGGVGVNVNVGRKAGPAVLKTSAGAPVYGPSGLINRATAP